MRIKIVSINILAPTQFTITENLTALSNRMNMVTKTQNELVKNMFDLTQLIINLSSSKLKQNVSLL